MLLPHGPYHASAYPAGLSASPVFPKVRTLFGGEKRQRYYLDYFTALDPDSRQVLRRIYGMATNPDTLPMHVILAMTEAVRNPSIFRLAVQNLSLRMSLKRALRDNAAEKAEKLHETLEDFHVALDAFVGGISLEEAVRLRTLKQERKRAESAGRHERREGISEKMLEDVLRFKEQFRPILEKFRRQDSRKN